MKRFITIVLIPLAIMTFIGCQHTIKIKKTMSSVKEATIDSTITQLVKQFGDKEKARIGIYIIYFEVFDLKGDTKHYKKTAVLASKL